ncbi:disease resistance RPP13-like protein 4 [Musa acuminata AAA Group]|uniref:disease resistance RPP13-like protein 4 n=1 Tax=Musa acuminata AAA Group TaxID=214697 RepID=UPI0031D82A70
MSKEGIIEVVVSPLLKHLENARRRVLEVEGSDAISEIISLFDNIGRDIRDMEDVFRRAERWEKDVVRDFGVVARLVDDILEEDCTLPKFQSKLRVIDAEISDLRGRVTPPLQLPPVESSAAASCGSLPSMFSSLQASQEWRRLELDKKIFESSTISNLLVSYENLDLQLKLCLLCFSIFPENALLKKRLMIYWWIGEGLVTPKRGKTAEEIGEDCLRKLIMNGMVEPVFRKRSSAIEYCKVHPWTRRMLISVARRNQFFDFDSEGVPRSDFSVSRHACLVTARGGDSQQTLSRGQSNASELIALFNVDEQYLRLDKSWFSEMRKIKVLQLGRWQRQAKHHIEVESTEFLEGLRGFKHLSYLSFQGISRITELPASIGKVSNLRILDLRACHNLEKLTSGITNLKKLTHLDVSECHLLEFIPKGISSLSELQVLKGFVVGDSRSKHPCRLNELAKLEKLRKLSMIIGNKVTVTEDELGDLKSCRALRSLTITWIVLPPKKAVSRLTRMASMTMTSLALPVGLEKLDLRCFPGKLAPEWLNPSALRSLKKLYLRGGTLKSLGLERFPPTWNVEVLRLKFLSELEVEWSQIRASFPGLVYLEIFQCGRLRSFPCDEDGVWVKRGGQTSAPAARGLVEGDQRYQMGC